MAEHSCDTCKQRYCKTHDKIEQALMESPRRGFESLWDSIYAKRGNPWKANDWVWVYTFERTKEPK